MQYVYILIVCLSILLLKQKKRKATGQASLVHTQSVFCELQGGLGNQLFQVAHAFSFARRHGKRLVIGAAPTCTRPPYWDSWLHAFQEFKAPFKVPDSSSELARHTYVQHQWSFHEIPRESTWLKGYFQSHLFFDEEMTRLFTLPASMEQQVKAKYNELMSDPHFLNHIVVHIRRSDYLKFPDYHGILSPDYFSRAIAEAKQRAPQSARLVVFSDDLDWCAQQPWLAGSIFVDEPNDVFALWLMGQFANFVMSNSSFSWWAVQFSRLRHSKQLVVAPDHWFGSKGHQDFHTIYRPEWIKCPVWIK